MNFISLLGAVLLGTTFVCGQHQVPTTQVGPCHRRHQGFARDLANCQQYFVCQNGNAIRARCPGNLAFDAHAQVCWWAEEVTCFNCPQTALYSLQPVPHTCHQFYRCWRGRATIHTCPNDLIFDPRLRRCNFLRGSGCAGDDFVPEGCPAHNGLQPVYLTHATDCNAYFVCENGRPREVRCQENLHFNPDLRVCDIPEKANCQVQQNSPWDPNNDDTPTWDPNANQSPLPCPQGGNGFLPHRDNCNAFFACSNNQQTLLHCAPGLHFDHGRQTCDVPRSARCWSRENPPGTPGAGESGPSFPSFPGGGPSFPPGGIGPSFPPGGIGPLFPPGGLSQGQSGPMIGPQLPPHMRPQFGPPMGPQSPRAVALDVDEIVGDAEDNEE